MPILFRNNTFRYTWAVGLFIGMPFEICRSQFSGGGKELLKRGASEKLGRTIIVERLVGISVVKRLYMNLYRRTSRTS